MRIADQNGSGGTSSVVFVRGKVSRTPTTTATKAKDAALAAKATVAPATATINPPIAGPMARAILNPIELRTSACASDRRGTVSGTEADQAGLFNAAPTASRAVNNSRIVASRRPSAATIARAAEAANISMLVRI